MNGMMDSAMIIISLLLLALDILAIFKIVNSELILRKKILWGLIIAVLPLLGLALYYLSGKKLVQTAGKSA